MARKKPTPEEWLKNSQEQISWAERYVNREIRDYYPNLMHNNQTKREYVLNAMLHKKVHEEIDIFPKMRNAWNAARYKRRHQETTLNLTLDEATHTKLRKISNGLPMKSTIQALIDHAEQLDLYMKERYEKEIARLKKSRKPQTHQLDPTEKDEIIGTLISHVDQHLMALSVYELEGMAEKSDSKYAAALSLKNKKIKALRFILEGKLFLMDLNKGAKAKRLKMRN